MQKRKKVKFKKITDPIYKQSVYLVTGLTISEFKEKYKRNDISDTVSACYLTDWKWVIIPPDTDKMIVVHECLHIVFDIFRESGIYLNEGSEEAYCYQLEWWVDKVMKGLNAKKL